MTQNAFCCEARCGSKHAGSVVTPHVSVPPATGFNDCARCVVVSASDLLQPLNASKAPAASIILMGIFPRNDRMALMPVIDAVNIGLARLADGNKVRYLNINAKLADREGKLLVRRILEAARKSPGDRPGGQAAAAGSRQSRSPRVS